MKHDANKTKNAPFSLSRNTPLPARVSVSAHIQHARKTRREKENLALFIVFDKGRYYRATPGEFRAQGHYAIFETSRLGYYYHHYCALSLKGEKETAAVWKLPFANFLLIKACSRARALGEKFSFYSFAALARVKRERKSRGINSFT